MFQYFNTVLYLIFKQKVLRSKEIELFYNIINFGKDMDNCYFNNSKYIKIN